MSPAFAALPSRRPLLWSCLSMLLLARCCWGLSASDIWSGNIWEKAQRARDKHASNSDRLMQHIWQHPERADQFVDCDILADSETDKHFQFLNLYDADDAREDLLDKLPADGYVCGLWPVKNGKSTIPYSVSSKVDSDSLSLFEAAVKRWEAAASVKFVKSSEKPGLEVVADIGCFATLGYHATEPRKLSLYPGRCTEAVVVHLLGHVLGLPHPTSTVGRANDLYLMPHHAAPRSMGVLRTRAGSGYDPLDIMAVDLWFCAASNRSTWRPRSPIQYRFAAATGHWQIPTYPRPEVTSMSTGLLQREIQRQAGAAACPNKCNNPCLEFHANNCTCIMPFQMSDDTFVEVSKMGIYRYDLAEKPPYGRDQMLKPSTSPHISMFWHTSNIDEVSKADADGTHCWQCSLIIYSLHVGIVFETEANRAVALGSRCTLFNLEVNGAAEEAWYRLCMQDLLHADNGNVRLAFRGPGSVIIRFFEGSDEFPEFYNQFGHHVYSSWSINSIAGCKCADGPEAEIQHTMVRQ